MPGCHATEQLEYLVYRLRLARFYFRTISFPNLSNGNQSLPEPWRHSRVHAIRCIHRWKCPPPPPIWESKPLVAVDNLGWAISLRKLNRDLEGFVNNWRPNPFHTFTRRLFCYYEEVLNCPALRSTKSKCHQQFNWNNLTHTRIPLQLFAQLVAEPVTFGSLGSSVHV